jgi:hypothetical protein
MNFSNVRTYKFMKSKQGHKDCADRFCIDANLISLNSPIFIEQKFSEMQLN